MEIEDFRKVGKPGSYVRAYLDDGRMYEGRVKNFTPDGYVNIDASKVEDPLGLVTKSGHYQFPFSIVESVVVGGYNFEEDAQ